MSSLLISDFQCCSSIEGSEINDPELENLIKIWQEMKLRQWQAARILLQLVSLTADRHREMVVFFLRKD